MTRLSSHGLLAWGFLNIRLGFSFIPSFLPLVDTCMTSGESKLRIKGGAGKRTRGSLRTRMKERSTKQNGSNGTSELMGRTWEAGVLVDFCEPVERQGREMRQTLLREARWGVQLALNLIEHFQMPGAPRRETYYSDWMWLRWRISM